MGARSGAPPLIYVIQFIELNQVEEDYTMVVTVENGATYDRIYPVQLARATPLGFTNERPALAYVIIFTF